MHETQQFSLLIYGDFEQWTVSLPSVNTQGRVLGGEISPSWTGGVASDSSETINPLEVITLSLKRAFDNLVWHCSEGPTGLDVAPSEGGTEMGKPG